MKHFQVLLLFAAFFITTQSAFGIIRKDGAIGAVSAMRGSLGTLTAADIYNRMTIAGTGKCGSNCIQKIGRGGLMCQKQTFKPNDVVYACYFDDWGVNNKNRILPNLRTLEMAR